MQSTTLTAVSIGSVSMIQDLHNVKMSTNHGLLQLPLELRLDIYSCCSAFTLLQLAGTFTQAHTEIHRYPTIFRQSRGFKFGQGFRYSQPPDTQELRLKIQAMSASLTLCLNNIPHLYGSEADLFIRTYTFSSVVVRFPYTAAPKSLLPNEREVRCPLCRKMTMLADEWWICERGMHISFISGCSECIQAHRRRTPPRSVLVYLKEMGRICAEVYDQLIAKPTQLGRHLDVNA
ncbi:hypothetical protein BJ508DRAFT_315397 [Ascobolus immersus RN42]|uniref:F-box domain-containing protein n=1 Tax=Ascobolus immersus RN42 TaxID=1160509 RepID=A0A3N4HFM3_ASCIM|nr:hypothetical protein BJ508DRAFT_315397 [Ascobolus immersus RN42]